MPVEIIFKSLPADRGWRVTRDDKTVGHYPNQKIAETAAARLGRAEVKSGNVARAILYKRDGTVAGERSYRRVTTPWLGIRN